MMNSNMSNNSLSNPYIGSVFSKLYDGMYIQELMEAITDQQSDPIKHNSSSHSDTQVSSKFHISDRYINNIKINSPYPTLNNLGSQIKNSTNYITTNYRFPYSSLSHKPRQDKYFISLIPPQMPSSPHPKPENDRKAQIASFSTKKKKPDTSSTGETIIFSDPFQFIHDEMEKSKKEKERSKRITEQEKQNKKEDIFISLNHAFLPSEEGILLAPNGVIPYVSPDSVKNSPTKSKSCRSTRNLSHSITSQHLYFSQSYSSIIYSIFIRSFLTSLQKWKNGSNKINNVEKLKENKEAINNDGTVEDFQKRIKNLDHDVNSFLHEIPTYRDILSTRKDASDVLKFFQEHISS